MSIEAAKRFLDSKKIAYQEDGSKLIVDGSIKIERSDLTNGKLPDLFDVTVKGNFVCSLNHETLTSLEGAPQTVGGNFYCEHNQLTSLEHAPQTVGGDFYCDHNQLTSLEHAPQTVGGDFKCTYSGLTSLEHAPQAVGGNFNCSVNQLTSLEHAPQTVGGNFECSVNQLTSLEHAPQTVGEGFYCDSNQLTSLDALRNSHIGERINTSDNLPLGDLARHYASMAEMKQAIEQSKLTALGIKQNVSGRGMAGGDKK